jgi:predicted transcriptional regulator
MAKTVTTRLEDKYVNKIDEIAAKKGIDRSALLRLFLVNSLREQSIQDSLENYKSGTVSLWEAAQHFLNPLLTKWLFLRLFFRKLSWRGNGWGKKMHIVLKMVSIRDG